MQTGRVKRGRVKLLSLAPCGRRSSACMNRKGVREDKNYRAVPRRRVAVNEPSQNHRVTDWAKALNCELLPNGFPGFSIVCVRQALQKHRCERSCFGGGAAGRAGHLRSRKLALQKHKRCRASTSAALQQQRARRAASLVALQ